MSSPSSAAQPRRSARERKQPKPITTVTEVSTTKRKRKLGDTDDEGPNDNAPDDEDAEASGEDEIENGSQDGDSENERPKKSRKKAKGQIPRTAAPTTRKPKKPRASKDTTATKSKKRAADAPNAPFDPAALTKATKISFDNPLFNAILNPNSALQSTVEDFLESLNHDENQASAELINMVLRCCACNDTIDSDTAVDYDGVVDRLDDFTESLKKVTIGSYPLISKAPPFHNTKPKISFRSSLSEFISRLVNSAALLGPLYNSQLMETLSVWLVPMSSSQIRSIRHTSTVIALEVEAALCQVAFDVEKEIELIGRMKEGEKKRARTKGATATSGKGKEELDNKLRSCKARQAKLEEFTKEFIDSVFIHRFRDLDPLIRTECISSLSTFFDTLPSHFATDSNYFRYVGWVLSDNAASVRLAAVKALQVVYEGAGAGSGTKKKKDASDVVVLPALRHFTTRFLPRLLEIARFDVDISVRVAVMNVLGCVDELALLPEEDRSWLGTLVFSDEPRVRKGVGRFVSGVWEEWVEEKMGEAEEIPARVSNSSGRGRGRGKGAATKGRRKAANDVDRDKVGIKGLGRLLVGWSRALERERRKAANEEEEEEEEEGNEERDGTTDGGGGNDARGIVPALVSASEKKDEGHIGLAVEALWDEMDVVRDWEGILDMLVLDHSASADNGAPKKKAVKKAAVKKGVAQTNGDAEGQEDSENEDDEDDNASTSTRVDQSWRLSEVEEGVLLEVLVASLRKTKKEDDSAGEPITQALIKALPRLFVKYQTYEKRIVDVLTLPTLMNLEVYLEMRETNAYTSLWSDVAKQFLTHTSSYVIIAATKTIISHLLTNTAMSNVNSAQILELEDELANSLRDAVAGPQLPSSDPTNPSSSTHIARDIEICHLTEDEVLTLTAIITRLRSLVQRRDLTGWMEENEGGKHSSVFDIISAISERARLSVGGEGEMLEQSLYLMTHHLLWKSRPFFRNHDDPLSQDEIQDQETLVNQRDAHVEKLVEYAVGTQVQGNGIVESVKRAAFLNLLDIHIMFFSARNDTEDDTPSLALAMADEVQWRLAGFVQAEIERYADSIGLDKDRNDTRSETEDDQSDKGGNDGDDAEGQTKVKKKITRRKEAETEIDYSSKSNLEQEYMFMTIMAAFLRVIHTGDVHVRHGAIILAHYSRLGPSFDSCAKTVVDVLKAEGLGNDNGQLIVLVITQAMKEAFALFKKSHSNDETNLVALAKLLSSCFLMRGNQLVITHRLDTQHVVEIHTNLIGWIVKQLGTRPKSNNKDHKAALLFFRALIPLITTVQSRDALKIKAHLDQAWVQAKIEPANTKIWEPLRAYEKRLGTAMGKDKPTKARSGKRKKDGGLSTDGEETEAEKLIDDDEHALSDDNAAMEPPHHRPPPRPRRTAAIKKSAPEPSGSDTEPESELEPSIPKTRPRPRAVYKSKASVSPAKNPSDSGPPNGVDTPVSTRKRPRADEGIEGEETPRASSHKRVRLDEEGEDLELPEQDVDSEEPAATTNGDEADVSIPSVIPDRREATPAADIQIRRKRIRH